MRASSDRKPPRAARHPSPGECLTTLTFLAILAVAPGESPVMAGDEAGQRAHPKSYWKQIADNEYAVPEGADPFELILELTGHLGSTDPELRDTYGYTIPAVWIYREQKLDSEQLHELLDRLRRNLRIRIGESGNDSVLLRSFSALNLSVMAAFDNRAPYLEPEESRALLDDALSYLLDEKDVRGYLPGAGWHHSTAHTADLLKFLARSPHLRTEDQGRILDAITAKFASVGVFTFGEDERLARAVLSLVAREDFDRARFDAWIDALVVEGKAVRSLPELDLRRYAAVQNGKNLSRALLVLVSGEEPSEQEQAVRGKLLEALGQF